VSDAAQQEHESVVHVDLLVAVEQRQSRLVGGEVEVEALVAAEHDHVLEQAMDGSAGDVGDVEGLAAQVEGVDVVSGVVEAQPVTLTTLDRQDRPARRGPLTARDQTPETARGVGFVTQSKLYR
jgi:hypothetical protein